MSLANFPQTADPILNRLSSVAIDVVDSSTSFGGNVLRQTPGLLVFSDIDFESFSIRGGLPLATSSFAQFPVDGPPPPAEYILGGNGKVIYIQNTTFNNFCLPFCFLRMIIS